jgi:lipopolysaccharide transport system permease protein
MVMMLPVLILITTAFAFGGGLILSVCTAKYRDLENIMQFLLRLFMFATPVVFPMSMVPEKLKIFFWINPLTAVLETFRSAFFSNQGIPLQYLLVSASVSFTVLLTGLILFRRHEIKAMDIV